MAAWSATQTLLLIRTTSANRRTRLSSDQEFELWSSCMLLCAKLLSLSLTQNQKKRPHLAAFLEAPGSWRDAAPQAAPGELYRLWRARGYLDTQAKFFA